MGEAYSIEDQPMAATFFGEGKWLTSFITPDSLEVAALYKAITSGETSRENRILACWDWVTQNVKYVDFVRGKLYINGEVSIQDDYWSSPSLTIRTKLGNCATKSFLLTSLLRKELSSGEVHCVLGNLYNGKPGGHAWVETKLQGANYVMESTVLGAPLLPIEAAERYDPIHLFNDQVAYAIEGKTLMVPFTKCYSEWLEDYLDFAYIQGRK